MQHFGQKARIALPFQSCQHVILPKTPVLPTLLIIANTPSDNTRELAEAVVRGARRSVGGQISPGESLTDQGSLSQKSMDVIFSSPLDADSELVRSASSIIIGTTENFGAMSGLIKDFFERIYYDCLEHTQGMPFAFYVRAGLDGQGTLDGVQRITTGLKWRLVQEPLLLHGKYSDDFVHQCEALGEVVAAGCEAGIY